jgi:hypothetical protein
MCGIFSPFITPNIKERVKMKQNIVIQRHSNAISEQGNLTPHKIRQ